MRAIANARRSEDLTLSPQDLILSLSKDEGRHDGR